ncbi:hypothetical protein B0H14DRAFT_2275369, partial [Mycena olivaceomarginata]
FVLSGVSILLEEYTLNGDLTCFVLVMTLPVVFFSCLQLVGQQSLIISPVMQYHKNSAFNSAVKAAANPAFDNNLLHIMIQCPVYKESLHE